MTYATDALPGFTGYDFCKDLKETFSLPSTVINDATAAAVAEHYCGNPDGRDVVLTLGTGLGSALVKPGVLNASCVEDLHLGHIILHEDGFLCKCGNKGCAEQYVSASALKRDSKQNDISQVFTKKEFESAMSMYFGEVIVRNNRDAKFEARSFPFSKDKYEFYVSKGLLSMAIADKFLDLDKRPDNVRRNSIFREYNKYFK